MNSLPKHSFPLNAHQLGGKAKAARIRAAYLENPNKCLKCNLPILPIEGQSLKDAKAKKFCGQSCAARFNNATSQNRPKRILICFTCNNEFRIASKSSGRKFCEDCWAKERARLDNLQKNAVSHRTIRGHAKTKMNGRKKICQKCGYIKFVEICHIKAVKDFSPTALLAEINAPENLIYLCPNCHWEHDHNLL